MYDNHGKTVKDQDLTQTEHGVAEVNKWIARCERMRLGWAKRNMRLLAKWTPLPEDLLQTYVMPYALDVFRPAEEIEADTTDEETE